MTASVAGPFPKPEFTAEVVADQLRDGYWLEAADVDGDGLPDLIGCGLTLGEIAWYRNEDWARNLAVNKVHMPVGLDVADITGTGTPDIIACYELYGPGGTIHHPNAEGGKIDWLEHPGPDGLREGRTWQRRYIGNTVGMHRLRVGHFTRTDRWEIIGLPIVAMEGVHALLPVVMFTQPEDPRSAGPWPMTVVDDTHFRMIHGATRKSGLIPDSDLDSLLLASDEGVTWLYFDQATQAWRRELIGTGELGVFERTGFKGSGDVDSGRIGDDPMAYVAAIEPYHGNSVAVYVRDGAGGDASPGWRRVLLDVFGEPNENGEGTGHSVLCADFDGDGDDEFLIGLRGPAPWQGVFLYKAIDVGNGVFVKWRVATESAARVIAADFNGDGTLDFATIAYKVPHYYEAPDAKLMVYRNGLGKPAQR
ncbi:VCBS repeat protein [Krasilnikovia cinnamomea]|uniref:VCBS repeat protein n=1 Tax=Krasilnikovia cinnamomea TaxID=349313 RepID=A0A4Q7ZSI4_9ACTN|nr:VCBS repeat-containing protein [Krasilnikovia cinnamomea]RZU53781.1 VCBS repeat protein [Krasilnikovia cinnamomea]